MDPGRILLDLAIGGAIGGGCLADISALRSEPVVFARVASDPTESRLIDALAAIPQAALAAINQARCDLRDRYGDQLGRTPLTRGCFGTGHGSWIWTPH